MFTQIATFVVTSFLDIWLYLLFSIPLAVAVRVTDASQYIRSAFDHRPLIAILLATLVGAFSPLCSCTVIPLITSLLIAGVPLGAVMAFWISSPTMDPEIFLLSAGVLGWELAVVRVLATLVLSLSAGFAAHLLERNGFFAHGILRETRKDTDWSWRRITQPVLKAFGRSDGKHAQAPAEAELCCAPDPAGMVAVGAIPVMSSVDTLSVANEGAATADIPAPSCGTDACDTPTQEGINWADVRRETVDATWMVTKFMLIAFVLEALINLYVPQAAIVGLLGGGNPLAVSLSALVGVPIYTTNIAAIPLVGGLLNAGMLPGAALAFLVAGPATTIPAMSAVYGIAKPRVFAVYVGVTLAGAIVMGYAYQLFGALS